MQSRIVWIVLVGATLIGGCRKPVVEETMRKAEKTNAAAEASADSARLAGDIVAYFRPTIEAFERVVADYPGTPQAERALYLIATIRNNDTHESQLAIDGFKRYLAAYPAGAQAPTALFLIGFIYNNELHNLDSSAASYREFLSRFPQNEMASSAQFELDHLGKPPEETFPDTTAHEPMTMGKKGKSAPPSGGKTL